MKTYKVLFFALLFIFNTFDLLAFTPEVLINVFQNGSFTIKTVYVYRYNPVTRDFEYKTSGASKDVSTYNGYNAAFDINSSDIPTPMINYYFEGGPTYCIRIEDSYFKITYSSGAYGDMYFTYNNGSFNSDGKSSNCGYEVEGPFTWSTKTITLANDFGNDKTSCYGNIQLNAVTLSNVGYSGTTQTREAGTFPHTISGIDNQYVNSYYRKWRNWSETSVPDISVDITTPQTISRTAKYAKQTTTTVSSSPSDAIVKLNGNTVSGGQLLYDDQSYTFTAEDQVSSTWINYAFNHWVYDGNTITNNTITANTSNNYSLTAYFTATIARPDPMNIHFTSSNGQNISLGWTEHPDNGVTQYQVWRQVTGGSTGAIATLSRGTTSYTDYDYIQNPNGDAKLFYTVKAYYSPSGTWNDPGYILNRGDMDAKLTNNNATEKLDIACKEVPIEYSISNYPNPFNPTTVISYQLPKDGFVTLKVYDILGKEVAALVNENKQAGYYNVTFNASNLPSGMYIYTIQANGFNQSKKMLLIK